MALIRSAHTADFQFQVDGGPADKLRVARFQSIEAVSQPFRVELELASKDGAIAFDDVVGKPGLLTIAGPSGKRYIHGTISRFEQVNRGKTFSTYEADLVPDVWLLSFRSRAKIFQEMNVPDIVKKVLDEAGIASDRYEFSLKATYPVREYCVQYRESDLTFISRLLEEEGIFYFFKHSDGGHVMVMADGNEATQPLDGGEKLKYRPLGGGLATEEHVFDFRVSQEVGSGMATLRDYNYETPATNLEVSKKADKDVDREIYDYPGNYKDTEDGSRLAKARLELLRATREIATGAGTCRRFVPGSRMTLEEFPRSDFNREYLLLRVQQTGSQPQVREEEAGDEAAPIYENSFQGISSKVPFRPERLTPRPTVEGTHTAVVVGPEGEQVYMDDEGRAKVQFYWDRDGQNNEKSTCWIRVSQGYAGSTHGIQFPPLVGDEVVVDFLEGDPDRPLIVGRVYNKNNPPPLKAEDRIQNVVLTPYQHRLMLDDKKKSITLSSGGGQSLHLGDAGEDSDFGNNVKITTADGHSLQLAKGNQHKGTTVKTEAGHVIEMRDEPNPGIFLVDKEGTIYLHLDTQNKTINLINDTKTTINVKCDGGTVNVESKEINVKAEEKVYIEGGKEIALSAPQIKVNGDQAIEATAPQVKIEGKESLMAKAPQTLIEGTTSLAASGGTVNVSGQGAAQVTAGGILTVMGSLVKIN